MLKNKTALFITAMALLFAGCSTRPSYVLSDKKMENILYDLYIADAVKSGNYMIFSNDSVKEKELTNDVFKKYKVTEQQFDTSLLWYAANLERYQKIIDRVTVRYDESAKTLREEMNKVAENDLADERHNHLTDSAWFILHSPGLLQNRFVFNLTNPAIGKEHNLIVNLQALGVSHIKPELFIHIFAPDTTLKYHETITADGRFNRTYKIPDNSHPYRIYGYIEIPDTMPAFILFRDFSLSTDNEQKAEQ